MQPALPSRRHLLQTLGGASLTPAFGQSARRPNILFIMSDDHAAHAISAYGSKINRTPNIDRLARGGMRFDNCFVTNSICTPSRAVIMTGQYSHMNGVRTLNDAFDPARDNVAKQLQAAGYATAIIGKWHLHSQPTGFDYWNILPGQGAYNNPAFIENGVEKKHDGYCTDLIGDFSLEWLKRRDKSKPFFLMCHHKAPHRAWQPAARYRNLLASETVPEPPTLYDNYENRGQGARDARMRVGEHMTKTGLKTDPPPGLAAGELRKWAYQLYIKDYLRCVQSVDDNVGRLLDYLADEEIENDTLVIYTSDQGFFLGDHGWYDKRFMYEESLRMPFLVRYPGGVRAGGSNQDIVLNLDFAETFLDYAGVKPPASMQGCSLRSLLEGKTPRDWRQSMYYRYWMHLADHYVPAHYGVRTARYKLIYFYGQPLGTRGGLAEPKPPYWELFDLQKDPREMRSVYHDAGYAGIVQRMKTELARLQKRYGDEPWRVPETAPQ
ncbi:MAG: sulfatase [Bryobacteraceae bacterium]|nr:sulfatase [Bryobacteraceae bacterium]